MQHTGVPKMAHTIGPNGCEGAVIEVGELTDPVFGQGAPWLVGAVLIAKQTRKHLIDDKFTRMRGRWKIHLYCSP